MLSKTYRLTGKILSILAIFVFLPFVPTKVSAQPAVVVNCGAGGSVQGTLDALTNQQEFSRVTKGLRIIVVGICNEDVFIDDANITVSGNPSGAPCNPANPGGIGTINGSVTVRGVRAGVEFMTVTGPGPGILTVDGATLDLQCADVSNNSEHGLSVERSSNAFVSESDLGGGAGFPGLNLTGGSLADLSNASVAGPAVARLRSQIDVANGSMIGGDVNLDILSVLVVDGSGTVTGSVFAERRSFVDAAAGSTINGSINLSTESAANDADTCDGSSTVFTGSVDPSLPCFSQDLRNILERIEQLESQVP